MIDARRSARLTLMALRSGVPPWIDFDPGVVRLGAKGEIMRLDEAIEDLTGRRKPLACFGDVEDGVLTLDFAVHTGRGSGLSHRNLFFDDEMLAEASGPDYRQHATLCIGRFEWMVLTFDELDAWCDDFDLLLWGYGEALIEQMANIPPEAAAAARRTGVRHAWDFRHPGPADAPRSTVGLVSIGRFDPPADLGPCARCRKRPARFGIEWFDDRAPRRTLCQRCIDEEITLEESETGRALHRQRSELVVAELRESREMLERMAEQEAIAWAMRPKPPFIRTFIERYRS